MTSTWARVCELCGAVGSGDLKLLGLASYSVVPEGWLHQDVGMFQHAQSIDVCKNCCATKTVGELRDKLKERETDVVVADGT